MSRAPDRRGLHLLEVGLAWPPETFLCWKLEGLAARGFRVTVAAVMPDGDCGVRLRGVEVISQPHWEEARARMLIGVAWQALRLALRSPARLAAALEAARHPIKESSAPPLIAIATRLRSYLPLARMRPDAVHFEWNSAAIHYLPLAPVWSCPTVVSCHGTDVNVRPYLAGGERFARWLRDSFRDVSAVHCVSEAIAVAAAELGMDRDRARVIRPGVDPTVFRPRSGTPARRAELRVVSVGDLRWLKGHEYAIRAVRRLLDSGVPVSLELLGGDPREAVGEHSDARRLDHAIDQLGLRERVRLCGPVGSGQVRDRLQAADVLVHTSLSEGIPTAVLEAMACGLPVVVSDCGGVREAVSDGVEGFVVPLRDPARAAASLRALHEDPSLRNRMGLAGRARVKAEFTLRRQLDELAALYQHVAAQPGPRPRPLPARPGRRRPARPSHEPVLRLLSIAPLSWTQGLDDAMQAVRLLLDRGLRCRYRIVGSGPYSDALHFARHQLGLDREVELVDAVGRERWPQHMAGAGAFVDAAVADSPRAALELASASGLAVLTTASGFAAAHPDAIVHELPARDPEAIAELLADAARSSSTRRTRAPDRVLLR